MKRGLEKFNELTESFAKLPGVGKKSAARFAYFVCMQDSFAGLRLAQNIEDAVRFIKRCERCGGLKMKFVTFAATRVEIVRLYCWLRVQKISWSLSKMEFIMGFILCLMRSTRMP